MERLKDFLSNPARVIGDHPDMTELSAIDDSVGSGESSQAWEVLNFDDDRDSSGVGEIADLYLKGPGMSGTDEIYCWMDTYSSTGDDYYNWRLAGMTGYASGQDISLQPGVTQGRLPRMLMWKNPIPYWFLGNGRRFVVIAKVSSVYEMAYGGFCLPYGLPTQFPYPLCIGGSACPTTTAAYNRYSSLQNDRRGFPNPYGSSEGSVVQGVFDTTAYYSSLKILQGTSWTYLRNRSSTTYYRNNNIWPYIAGTNTTLSPDDIFSKYLRENIDGTYPIFPLVIMLNNPVNHIMGELQGCYAVPGYGGISAEDTFEIGGDTYITFPTTPNADRGDWMCIKKE
jgi:hypothetical protein